MNILVVTSHGMYTNYTGSFVHNQARAYVQLGHRVRVVLPMAVGKCTNEGKRFGPPVQRIMVDGVEICYVRHLSASFFGAKIFNARSSALMCKLFHRAVLKNFIPDVIHAHTVHFGGTVAKALNKYCKVPIVITTHGGDTNVAIEQKERKRAKKICENANTVVAVSSKCLEKINSLKLSIPTMCILNGFCAEYVQQREKTPYSVIQVGALSYQKRVELTVRAMAILKEKYPKITLTLVGQGDQREHLERLCEGLALRDRVTFTGQLSNGEVLDRMARSEVFLMPSVNEGFGIVYLEAMASACITVGTQGEGIADVIVHGKNGYLVKPDDVDSIVETLSFCFDNRQNATLAAEQAGRDARELNWENNAQKHIALFESLLNGVS